MLVICTPQRSWLEIEKGKRNIISAQEKYSEDAKRAIYLCAHNIKADYPHDDEEQRLKSSRICWIIRWLSTTDGTEGRRWLRRSQSRQRQKTKGMNAPIATNIGNIDELGRSGLHFEFLTCEVFVRLFLINWLHRVKVKPVFLCVRISNTRSARLPARWGRLLNWICCLSIV